MITGASQVALVVKNPPANAGDTRGTGLIPGLGRSPGGGHGNPLQYSCLENPTDRGARQDIIHGVTKGWTHKRLSTHASSWLWNCRREKEWTGLPLPPPPTMAGTSRERGSHQPEEDSIQTEIPLTTQPWSSKWCSEVCKKTVHKRTGSSCTKWKWASWNLSPLTMPAGGRGQGPRVGFSSLPIPPQPRHHQGVYVAAGRRCTVSPGRMGQGWGRQQQVGPRVSWHSKVPAHVPLSYQILVVKQSNPKIKLLGRVNHWPQSLKTLSGRTTQTWPGSGSGQLWLGGRLQQSLAGLAEDMGLHICLEVFQRQHYRLKTQRIVLLGSLPWIYRFSHLCPLLTKNGLCISFCWPPSVGKGTSLVPQW